MAEPRRRDIRFPCSHLAHSSGRCGPLPLAHPFFRSGGVLPKGRAALPQRDDLFRLLAKLDIIRILPGPDPVEDDMRDGRHDVGGGFLK